MFKNILTKESISFKDLEEIVEDAVNVYKDYVEGDEDELYRGAIDPNEEIRSFIKPGSEELFELIYDAKCDGEKVDVESGFYDYFAEPEKCKTYGEYAIPAQKIEDNCRYLYSLIIEAYQKKAMEIEKSQNSIEDTQKPYENNESGEDIKPDEVNESGEDIKPDEVNESRESIKPDEVESEEDSNLSKFSEEELDKFIEGIEAKQKENEQKIERLKKIKRAKELIALSKEQDKEIADLESQIQMKGIGINE